MYALNLVIIALKKNYIYMHVAKDYMEVIASLQAASVDLMYIRILKLFI